MRDKAVLWLNQQKDKSLNYDGVNGCQCVDYFNYYYERITGRKPYADGYGVPSAYMIWDVPNSLFDKITTGIPQHGAILIYNDTWGNGDGHVEMVLYADETKTVVSAQNTLGEFVSEETRPPVSKIKGLIGWLDLKAFKEDGMVTKGDAEKSWVLGMDLPLTDAGYPEFERYWIGKSVTDMLQWLIESPRHVDVVTKARNFDTQYVEVTEKLYKKGK